MEVWGPLKDGERGRLIEAVTRPNDLSIEQGLHRFTRMPCSLAMSATLWRSSARLRYLTSVSTDLWQG